ncbi:enoyl-CoA hydratase/isomerase family protein [Myxococcota bacterium]|nr:enoyl-CoA hydratase/isomerase family protein [Myxococcota bacterium]
MAIHADAAPQLASHFDVVLEDSDALPELAGAIERTPLASLALVQLLRLNESQDVRAGLVCESLVYSMLQAGPEFQAWLATRPAPRTREASREPAVLARREGDHLLLELNRSEKRNAFSAEMRDALCEGLQLALCDPSISRVRLSGLGPSFCSGGDLDEFGSFPDPATAHAIRTTRSAGRLLDGCAERVQSRLHGACVGAGIELPAFGRHITARRDTFFQLPEVSMGLVPGAGGTVSILKRMGRQRTAWLALSGSRLDSETALRWGLIDALE